MYQVQAYPAGERSLRLLGDRSLSLSLLLLGDLDLDLRGRGDRLLVLLLAPMNSFKLKLILKNVYSN